MPEKNGIKAVIFDFDGVIADSKSTIYAIYRVVLAEMKKKFPLTIEEFTDVLDGNYRNFYASMGVEENEIEKANEIYKRHYMQLEKDIRPFHGVSEVLSELRKRGYKIGISSNTHEFIIRRLLAQFGFESHVDAVVGGKDINKLKPDPAQILLVMEKLGVKHTECVFIGDMEVDMLAGKAAKVAKLIAATYGYHPRERLEKFGPDAFVNNPFQILGYL
ncbi:MAG: HAD family hydrolase [Candidatus Aenigmarchaeota archaeon]|nr:HAD family hydrolase [Candidatus Aenigmarchaeota archaeon]